MIAHSKKTLKELSEEWKQIVEILEDDECTDELLELLHNVEGDLEEKIYRTTNVLEILESNKEFCRNQEKRFNAKVKTLENNIKHIKSNLMVYTKLNGRDTKTGGKRWEIGDTKLSWYQKSYLPEDLSIEEVPEQYVKTVETKSIMKEDLLKAIKNGEEIDIPLIPRDMLRIS